MSFWRRLFGGGREAPSPQRLDYFNEALALERQGDLDAALTSYRLALRDDPRNVKALQNMAIVCSKQARPEEALRYYRQALAIDPDLPGAHYGVGFLLRHRGERGRAAEHLRAFLAGAPQNPDLAKFVEHAERTLQALESEEPAEPTGAAEGA
ncbi:MAG: tetratricopeptide repeat protein [Gemmatimonadales bacterium]